MDRFLQFLDPSRFPPRWECGLGWHETPALGWLHIFSDIAIFSAYFAIPCILLYFIRRRGDLPFRMIFALFGAFILFCGTTHLIEAIIFWWPIYPFAGIVKFLTATISWATVIALVKVAPQALAMRSPQELEREIKAREKAEDALMSANRELESRVKVRTEELQLAVNQLHQERNWFRTTLLSIGDGVIVTDSAARVSFLNTVAQDLTGWSDAAAQNQPLTQVFTIVHEKTRETVQNPALTALEHGKTVTLANHTILIARDGREWPITDSAAPIRDAAGAISGAVLVFRDESERRNRLRLLQESERKLRFALDASELGLWELSVSEKRVSRTRKHDAIFGHDEALAEWHYGTYFEHIVPEQRELVDRQFKEAIASSSELDIECQILRSDGKTRWIWIQARSYMHDGDKSQRLLGTIGDITERKRIEEELRKAHLNKDRFLATLAHELRNPLAPIRTGLAVLKKSDEKNEIAARTEEMMDRQLTSLVRLVDDLLDVSRISSGKLYLRKERIDLAKVLEHAIETIRPTIEIQQQCLDVSIPDSPIYLVADSVRLSQVFQNILINAAKYSDERGHIALTAFTENEQAVVSIKDNGCGISASDLPIIFEMFSQSSSIKSKTHGGLGIGLSLARSLVQLHGGRIEARSEGPDKGSEFVVYVPLAPVEIDSASKVAAAPAVDATNLRILVVDDNVDAAEMLLTFLKLSGHKCRIAHDAAGAMKVAEDFNPQIILSDIGLPLTDGYELARNLRAQEWGKNVILIALTGWGQKTDMNRSYEAGFDLHLTKPVDPDKLLEQISTLLKNR
jgi:PAS domain S-box-containing protein